MQDFDTQSQGDLTDYSRTKRIVFKANPVLPLVHSQRIREYIRKFDNTKNEILLGISGLDLYVGR